MATISLTDSIFTKLNDEELLLINELYLEMKKYKNIIDELERYMNVICMDATFEEIGITQSILKKIKRIKRKE